MEEDAMCKEKFILTLMNLRDMRTNQTNTDVILECDGGAINAHKCILMAASTYFYKMFTIDMIESNRKRVEFQNISQEAMQVIVDSFYGEIAPNLKYDFLLLKNVLEISHLIQDLFLFNFCMKCLLNLLAPENYVDVWNLALKYEHNEGKQHVMAFILENLVKVQQNENLTTISNNQMREFVTYASTCAPCGDKIMQLIITWTKCKPDERMQEIVDFVKLMDKSKLSNDYIQKLLDAEEVVKTSLALTKILTAHAMSRIVSYQKNIQIHFYCLTDPSTGKTLTQTYCLREKEWYMARTVQLPTYIATNWFPLTSIHGEQFYFAIATDKRFVAYNQRTRQVYVGPSVAFECRVTGVVDGNVMYVWNYETLVQFNVENTSWKSLAPIRNVLASSLLAMNGRLFFHAAFPPSILSYNFLKNEWDLKANLREDTEIKSIKCKCFNEDCKGKLFFIENENELLSYDPEADLWEGKTIPELKCRLPICMNCDESFILFGDKHNLTNFFLVLSYE
uniref:BTB domain-containing protein n=1 Tax=Strigamia maritima TaxID=126957 RepID=T1J6V5_STRMM